MSKRTNTQIKNAKGKDKPYSLSDGLGLSLLINPNGSKWWRYRFQFHGKAKLMSLGTYPTLTLAEARRGLYEARGLVSEGINPIEKNQQSKDTMNGGSTTLKDVSKMMYQTIII